MTEITKMNEQVNGRVLAQETNEVNGVILTEKGKEIINAINERVKLGYCTIEVLDEEERFGVLFDLTATDCCGNEIFNERISVRYDDDIDDVVEKLNNFTGAMFDVIEFID